MYVLTQMLSSQLAAWNILAQVEPDTSGANRSIAELCHFRGLRLAGRMGEEE